ncbi:methyltransferase [uncultured Polaribacter sp.]|uniref:tRNA1(Val) (adenine(37)-N6)-methyltransferase n=1 Tax=uncultured Polaribacter sp. TaxID=174711 RepID=UPI00262F8C0A|nr:methyltransferase [uncultured Polaribacter sp.]
MLQPFQFKEFKVYQDKTAMKIGTDGVLLGAWCSLENYPNSILDIGSGTGVISLMIAQRCDAMTIDAVEIDEKAYEQTVENFENSEWGDRLYCYHSSFQEFADEIAAEEEFYDVIVSNPPFYRDEFETDNVSRNRARFTSSLSFETLLSGVAKILSKNGVFSLIIPFKEEQEFIQTAKKYELYINHICRVQGNPSSAVKRSLLCFSFQEQECKEECLIIETERHQYTQQYKDLTKDFYLKM